WLAKVTNTVNQHWQRKNASKKGRLSMRRAVYPWFRRTVRHGHLVTRTTRPMRPPSPPVACSLPTTEFSPRLGVRMHGGRPCLASHKKIWPKSSPSHCFDGKKDSLHRPTMKLQCLRFTRSPISPSRESSEDQTFPS